MTVLIGLIALVCFWMGMMYNTPKYSVKETTYGICTAASAISIALVIVTITFQRSAIHEGIEWVEETYESVEWNLIHNSNQRVKELEEQVLEVNQWITRIQQQKDSVWSLWVPEEVRSLELIEY